MKQTAVEFVINEIDQQQKGYIDLTRKDKSIKKEVDAILTATTLLKMKCELAKELEKQQSDDYAIEFAEWCLVNNVYKSETFENDNLFLCGTKKYDDGTDRIYYMDELLKEFKKGL